jgi:hypothetical protein
MSEVFRGDGTDRQRGERDEARARLHRPDRGGRSLRHADERPTLARMPAPAPREAPRSESRNARSTTCPTSRHRRAAPGLGGIDPVLLARRAKLEDAVDLGEALGLLTSGNWWRCWGSGVDGPAVGVGGCPRLRGGLLPTLISMNPRLDGKLGIAETWESLRTTLSSPSIEAPRSQW